MTKIKEELMFEIGSPSVLQAPDARFDDKSLSTILPLIDVGYRSAMGGMSPTKVGSPI